MNLRILIPFGLALTLPGFAAGAAPDPWLDAGDYQLIEGSAQDALENARTDQATTWVNPDTGSSGSITPVATYQTAEGVYCREYIQTATIGGKEQQVYGTACRMSDGSWRIANGDPEPTDQQIATSYARFDEYPSCAERPCPDARRDSVAYYYPYPSYAFFPFYPFYPFALQFTFGDYLHVGHGLAVGYHLAGHYPYRGYYHWPAYSSWWYRRGGDRHYLGRDHRGGHRYRTHPNRGGRRVRFSPRRGYGGSSRGGRHDRSWRH